MADDAITNSNGILTTFRENLALCSKLVEAGDCSSSEESIDDLVNYLDSIEPRNETVCLEILNEIHRHIASPSLLKQELVDALAFELPKAVSRFACVSSRCLELAEKVVLQFVDRCSPRDMLSILCEALISPREQFRVPAYFIPLLNGLSKVLILTQRRKYEQVKVAVPVVLYILKKMSFELENVDSDYEKLFHTTIDVANSIKEVCGTLVGKDSDKIRALLGLYVLQIMALISINIPSEQCPPLVLELSLLLQHCKLSYMGLVTGHEVDIIQNLVFENDGDDSMDSFSRVRLGAVLGVIWGCMISDNAKTDLSNVIKELQGSWTLRWESIGMLRTVFSCANLPWKLKKHGIRFLLDVMDGIVPHLNHNSLDQSIHSTTMYANLQAIEIVIMYASESDLRKDAFSAFKKVLADVPPSIRFDVLMALIVNSDSSSMIAILLDCVKEEMRKGNTDATSSSDAIMYSEITLRAYFWNPSVLEFVELILKPPKGGPPSLPDYSDAILSALNLYRFIFITESTGNSNYTGILSKDNLQKAYNEWFLPLRSLVTGTMAETQEDKNQMLTDAICALYPVEMVLYRCIELVENELKHS